MTVALLKMRGAHIMIITNYKNCNTYNARSAINQGENVCVRSIFCKNVHTAVFLAGFEAKTFYMQFIYIKQYLSKNRS